MATKAKPARRRSTRGPRPPTGPHAAFHRDILAFGEALRASKHGAVSACTFGAPRTAAQLDAMKRHPDDDSAGDEFIVIPEGIRSIATSFDGAALEWAWHPPGGKELAGSFLIPSVRRGVNERGHNGPCEVGVNWHLELNARYAHVVTVDSDGSEFTVLIDRETDYAMSDELEVPEVLAALADHLALPGWELSLCVHNFEQRHAEALEACRTNAIAVRNALELPMPECLRAD